MSDPLPPAPSGTTTTAPSPDPMTLPQTFDRLLAVSAELLEALARDDVHAIARLLMGRGPLLTQIQQANFSGLPAHDRQRMQDQLTDLETKNAVIHQELQRLTDQFEGRLSQVHQHKVTVSRYKSQSQPVSTRLRDA